MLWESQCQESCPPCVLALKCQLQPRPLPGEGHGGVSGRTRRCTILQLSPILSNGRTFSFPERKAAPPAMPHLMRLFLLLYMPYAWECSSHHWQLAGTILVSRCNNPCIKSDTRPALKYHHSTFPSTAGRPVLNLTQGLSYQRTRSVVIQGVFSYKRRKVICLLLLLIIITIISGPKMSLGYVLFFVFSGKVPDTW